MSTDELFDKKLEKRFSNIKSKIKITPIDMDNKKARSSANKKIFITAASILIFIVLGGRVFAGINEAFSQLPLNDSSPNKLMQSNQATNPNISCKVNGITVTIDGVLADTQRTLIELDVKGKKFINRNELIDPLCDAENLVDENGISYQLKSNGGYGDDTRSTDMDKKIILEFAGLSVNSKSVLLTINSIDGVTGKWQMKIPVNVIKPNEFDTNIKFSKDDTTYLVNKVIFSGSLIKIEGKYSAGDKISQWNNCELKVNNESVDYMEDYFDSDEGSFCIEFSSTALNGNLKLIFYWDDNTKSKISIPANSNNQ